MDKPPKFLPGVFERAVCMVQERRGNYPLWAAMASIASNSKRGGVPRTSLE
ncbi:hypothetical protein EDC36_110100 [Tepidimonas ignava]|uniref:Uncharacterized protein n=1 Tax=Tepidimonas ignava TaxID=114249 RepID=A0A4R3LD99_9BURK|nr:hypothetical protein EDC36_110100 [Tepidimonas ignava]TSE21301.1 hypothetical protein Tigna_01689 [Tepidimonas ignava]